MNKVKPIGKIFGIVLCCIPIIIFIFILIFSSDIRGYKELLNKYYSSVQRGVEKDFIECYPNDNNITINDVRIKLFDNEQSDESYFDGKNIYIKYKINDKAKVSDTYKLDLIVTMSVDDESCKTSQQINVKEIDGKWKIIE